MRAQCLAVLLTVLVWALASCGAVGGPAIMAGSGQPAPAFAHALPFPVDRQALLLTAFTLNGVEDSQRSPGVSEDGNSLLLNAGPDGMEFAIYNFNPNIEVLQVDVNVDSSQTTSYYVGLGDFDGRRWILSGPFSNSESLQLDNNQNVSGSGNIPLAIIAAPNANVKLDSLQLAADNKVPVADLQASATGMAPITIDLDASASNDEDGFISSYEWDFEDDGTYDFTDSLAATSHEFTVPGDYTVRLRVTDNYGATATDTVSFTVDPPLDAPPVAQLSLTPSGPAPLDVTADASGSTDDNGISKYEFDLDADGVFEIDNAANPVLMTTFTNPGGYTIGLRVTDLSAQSDTDEKSVVSQGWLVVTVDDAGETGFEPSLANINGHPAIAYNGGNYMNLSYAVASTEFGEDALDWAHFAIDISPSTGRYPCLREINGSPAVTCGGNIGHVRYARASTATGSSAVDWSVIDATTTSSGGDHSSLALINGNPAFCWKDSNGDNLRYVRSNTTTGASAGDWPASIMVDTDSFDLGSYSSLAEVDAKPAIAYQDSSNGPSVKYAYASTADGMSPLAWTAITVDATSAYFPSLAVVNGHPAMAYWYGADNDVIYAYASTAQGTMQADWGRLVLDGPGPQGVIPSLALVGGFPMVAHYSETPNQDLRFTSASTASGDSLVDWSPGVNVDTSGDVGAYCTIADINGYPGIAYYAGSPAGDLKYAIGFQ